MSQEYGADHIKVLEGLEAVRKRPSMYIGSTGINGLNHLIYEIVDNSIDEAMAGYCSDVDVIIDKDNVITVKDNGRGIPIDTHKEKNLPAVEVVLTTLHAGGKFEGEGYKVSGGLHGVGISVVNALSEWLEVTVHRDGKKYVQTYYRGDPKELIGTFEDAPEHPTGTVIKFKPDATIFDTVEFGVETIVHRLKELAYLNRGITINYYNFRDNETEEDAKQSFSYEGGIASYVEDLTQNKEALFTPPIYLKKSRELYEVEVAVQYVSDHYDEQVASFANNIRTREGGTHLSGFRTALTRVINSFAKKYDLVKKDKSSGLTGQDLREGLVAVISVKLQNPQFEGQTKTKLGNSEIKGVVDSLLDEGLTDYIETNPKVGKLIITKALEAQRVREAARKAQDLARRKSSLESTTLPGKLADCTEKDPSKCEIFLVEGDSAGGSAKQGRDRYFQAILPLRGKVLNVEKSRLDKILANEELRSLITAVGPEALTSLSTKRQNTDVEEEELTAETILSKLRYHKIVIMTDADVDGAHIRTLLLTFFFRYARELVEAGALYIAQPPLYLIRHGRSGGTYAYNDKELEEELKRIGKDKDKVNIQRYKGLGEMNPDQLWDTTLNPEKRTMLQVNVHDAEVADEIFSLLMGSKVDPRKAFIEKYASTVRWIDV
jgi:DNA gyrase subunit B